MSNKDSLFKFNLLPPKSAQEVALEEEGGDSTLYAFVLVFAASFIFLVLVAVQVFLIDPRLAAANLALTKAQTELSSYNSVRIAHGERHVKLKALAEVLELSIEPDAIFTVADKIASSAPNITIEAYGREQNTGLFLFQLIVDDMDKLPTVIEKTKAILGVEDVLIRSASVDTEGSLIRVNLSLVISNI